MERALLSVLIALGVIVVGLVQVWLGITRDGPFYTAIGAGQIIIGSAYLWYKRPTGQP